MAKIVAMTEEESYVTRVVTGIGLKKSKPKKIKGLTIRTVSASMSMFLTRIGKIMTAMKSHKPIAKMHTSWSPNPCITRPL